MLAVLAFAALVPGFADAGLALGNDQACWADLDGDGWSDLIAGGKVWWNDRGTLRPSDVNPGPSVAADYDNDGRVDVYGFAQHRLYRNVGGRKFVEVPLPEQPATVTLGACWSDLNGDGFVDLHVGGYEDWDKQVTYPSYVLLNEQGKMFRVAWTDASFRTRGVTASRFDREGNAKVYVSNYRLQPNRLLRWSKDGFVDEATDYGVLATSPGFDGGHSIGAAWGDFDGDGELDLFAGNFAHRDSRGDQPKSRFLRNTGALGKYRFEDKGTCGVFYQESYASQAAADFDNDGCLDLYFTTVYGTASFNTPNHPVLFRNAKSWQFADATAGSGLESLEPTYQAAWADFDHSGHPSLVTAGKLFRNVTASGHWLELTLEGDGRRVNRSAVGAIVRVLLPDKVVTRQVEAGTGQGNQNDLTLHFGLGDYRGKVRVQVLWPNGRTSTYRRVATNRLSRVKY